MDKTETNIRMCQKATELQALRPPLHKFYEGDYFASKGYKDKWYITLASPNYKGHHRSIYFRTANNSVWLPHQDQFQAMFEYSSVHKMLDGFYGLVCTNTQEGIDYYKQFTSMEQLWLAFAMKELHNKVWNGEDWILPAR